MLFVAEEQRKANIHFLRFIKCNRVQKAMENQKILSSLNETSDSRKEY